MLKDKQYIGAVILTLAADYWTTPTMLLEQLADNGPEYKAAIVAYANGEIEYLELTDKISEIL